MFTTTEAAAYEGSWRVREQNGHLMPFQQNKLLISLYKSLEHRQSALDDATALLGTILGKLRVSAHDGVLEPQNIAETAHGVLAHFDTPAAVSYRAFHPLKNK